MSDADVEVLAREAGLLNRWRDDKGREQRVSPENLRRLLDALGLAAGSAREIAESRQRLREQAQRTPSLISADAGAPITLPAALGEPRARLHLAGGEARDVMLARTGEGLAMPAVDEPGYHKLQAGDAEITLAVAPQRAFAPADAAARKLWGVGLQLYSLRDEASPDFGDFGALARFADAAGRAGADLLAISPTHALFAADPSRFSPYAPSTRLFHNGLYADPRIVFPDAPLLPASEGAPAEGALVDWEHAAPARLARLAELHRRFQAERSGARRADFEAFRHDGGADLRGHAIFEALHAHFLRLRGARGWRAWPAGFRDPRSDAVSVFARENANTVELHVFIQWLADRSLEAAQDAARASGMAVGLVADLAVGMDPEGSHAWSRPQDLLAGVNVGAPPDVWGPAGQDWGIAAFSPAALAASGYHAFLATLRAAARHAGGVRIDHAMGLKRLWLVPRGASPAEGAYLAYPFDDLLRLLALESWLNRAVVVAEDLGTVPEGFREALQARAMMGMQVLWFERDRRGGFTAPRRWSDAAAALTSTHDLPTVAGWWRGRDIDWIYALGRRSPYGSEAEGRASRARERRALWRACVAAGAAEGAEPAPDQPDRAVDAAIGLVAKTPCPVAIVQAEDLAGLVEQPNLPGTLDEHPNWRRRLPPTDALMRSPAVRRRIDRLNAARPRSGAPS